MVDGKDITEGRSDYGLSSTADVEGAKAALEEAGYPNGEGFPTVQLSFYSDDNVKKIAEAIAEMWQTNLGIQVEVTSSDWAVFYDAVQAGEYDVAAMGWSADYVNPMSFLPLLYTDDVSNNVFYSNKDYDAVVDQIQGREGQHKVRRARYAGRRDCLQRVSGTSAVLQVEQLSAEGLCKGRLYDLFF